MVRVTQGVQKRYFKYDSLGRLIRVNQPEQEANSALAMPDDYNTGGQWTAGFTYDIAGNVITATDANGVTIANTYDKANRVTTRSYSGEPAGQTTPTVNFYYDGKGLASQQSPNYAKGKLTKVDNGISATVNSLFDNFGRLTQSSQITDGQTYTSSYQYNLSGALVQETYPSGRVVKNEFEPDGDLQDVSSKRSSGSVFTPYVSNFSYTASGGISQMKLGNGKWETAVFNPRLQVTQLGLGNSATDASLWKVNYEYGELSQDGSSVDAAKNTGNIARQILTVPGTSFTQSYRYDPLYRLTEARETTGTTQNWIQNWNYDRYGNRNWFTQSFAGSTNPTVPTVDQNTNRFNTGQGFVYDKDGNVVQDTDPITSLNRTFVFNGDNKQSEVKDASGATIGQYFYDGEGKRVKKVIPATGETTVFVYSSGKLIAEYSTQTNPNPAINYMTTDHLGSPRIITDQFGQVRSRRDFMPFGEEIDAGIGARSAALSYSSATDSLRQKFTGYQKDSETSLDFAEARMYENRYGRFTAVDPLLASGQSANPQTFNRYVYVGNNPMAATDPTGLDWYQQVTGDRDHPWRYKWFDDDPGDKWSAVDFGDSTFMPILNWVHDGSPMGTGYLDRYRDNILTQTEYDKEMASYQAFAMGGGCYANPQCAGLRNLVNDNENIRAMQGAVEGFPMGVTNNVKGKLDIPTWNLLPPTVPLTLSLNSAFGVEPWFNYATPRGPYQQAGATAGSLSTDLVLLLVAKKVGDLSLNPFGVRGGNGLFGRKGLRMGSYEINALYENPNSGGGTVISFKQKIQEGNLFRLDYGEIHNANRVGFHSNIRFTFNGVRYGSTAQRYWYPSTISPPFFKSH